MTILDEMKRCKDSYTFKIKNENGYISVKKDFLDECPNPEEYEFPVLYTKYYIDEYLHNLKVPAIQVIDDEGMLLTEYWVNGISSTSVRYEDRSITGMNGRDFNDMVEEYNEDKQEVK